MATGLIIQFKGQVLWQYFQDPPTGVWVAVCDQLKLTVEAENWSALHESNVEAITLFFEDLYAAGGLQNFLKKHGWQVEGPLPPPRRRRFLHTRQR